jgi:hypothetical protein
MRNQSSQPDVQGLSRIGWSFASLTATVALIAAWLVLGALDQDSPVQQTSLATITTVR